MTPKRLLIADDNRGFIEALKQVISPRPDLSVADVATDGQELLGKIADHHYDLLILDISLSGPSGLDILTQIRGIRPGLPVLVLSLHPEEAFARHAIGLGAAGFLSKGGSSQELIEAIREIALGRRYLSASLAPLLDGRPGAQADHGLLARLSSREYQVLQMLAAGATPRSIAQELMVGLKTVLTYRTRILQKLGAPAPREPVCARPTGEGATKDATGNESNLRQKGGIPWASGRRST